MPYEIDDDFFDWMTGGALDPEYPARMKLRAIDKDLRINKPARIGIDNQYKELHEFQNSDVYKNTERAKALLSENFAIDSDSLRDAMKRSYTLTDNEYDSVLNELANSKDVNVRMSLFDHKIKIKKLE